MLVLLKVKKEDAKAQNTAQGGSDVQALPLVFATSFANLILKYITMSMNTLSIGMKHRTIHVLW